MCKGLVIQHQLHQLLRQSANVIQRLVSLCYQYILLRVLELLHTLQEQECARDTPAEEAKCQCYLMTCLAMLSVHFASSFGASYFIMIQQLCILRQLVIEFFACPGMGSFRRYQICAYWIFRNQLFPLSCNKRLLFQHDYVSVM